MQPTKVTQNSDNYDNDILHVHIYVTFMVKTFQFTTKCKIDCWVIALKQQKSK